MWSDGRVSGLGSLLLGAIACGLVGALVARHALIGFTGEYGLVAAILVTGLGLAGLGCLCRGLRGLRDGSFRRVG